MKREWKTILIAVTASLSVYIALPMLYAYLLLRGNLRENTQLAWMIAAAALGAALGMYIARRRGCALTTALLALLVGPTVQILSAILGVLIYSGGIAMDQKRWMLFVVSYACAFVCGAMIRPRGRKKRRGSIRTQRRRG